MVDLHLYLIYLPTTLLITCAVVVFDWLRLITCSRRSLIAIIKEAALLYIAAPFFFSTVVVLNLTNTITYICMKSEKGILTDPNKVAAVQEWALLSNLHEVKALLSFVRYYRCFLDKLTTKGEEFVWGESQEHALSTLQTMMDGAPVVA